MVVGGGEMKELITGKYGREEIWDALRILDDSLDCGYIDISDWPDEVEIEVVKEALRLFKNKYKFNQ